MGRVDYDTGKILSGNALEAQVVRVCGKKGKGEKKKKRLFVRRLGFVDSLLPPPYIPLNGLL